MFERREWLKAGAMAGAGAMLLSGTNAAPAEEKRSSAGAGEAGFQLAPQLMFEGAAEEAMKFYLSIFENSKIEQITKYGPNQAGKEGTVQHAVFSLNGYQLMCIDSPAKHDFTFTPSISLFVKQSDRAKLDQYFAKLSAGGQVLMPLQEYPFSARFGWVQDRFGVSWQLMI